MFTYPVGTLNPGISVDTDFKFTINTSLGTGDTFTWPTVNGQTYDFYWLPGDGSDERHVTAYDDADITHTYSSAFNGQISAYGKIGGWSFNNGGDKLKITSVDNWGDVGFDYLTSAFRGSTNLGSVANMTGTTTSVTNLLLTFATCPNLIISSKLFGDMANVLSLQYCFLNSGITVAPNLDNLTLLNSMYGAFHTTQISIPENYLVNQSNVTNYRETFYNLPSQVLPSVIFDLSNLSIVSSFDNFMNAVGAGNSSTGIVQDVWNYATSATSANTFLNQTSLTNYASIPNGWKGL